MTRTCAILLLVSSWTATGAWRGSAESGFAVKIETKIPGVVLHHDLSRKKIRSLAGSKGGRDVAGLTRQVLKLKMSLAGADRVSEAGERTFWIESVTVLLEYVSVDVYLPREYKQGTCRSDVLLEHENEHVARDRVLAEEYAGRIKAALQTADLPTARRPLRGPEAAEGMKRSEAAVRRLIEPLQQELEEKRRQVSEALDTPEAYAALQARCAKQ